MGIRHGFGLFLQPMSTDLGWGRETFALAMAVQNLLWGVTQPFAGMLADKYGTAKVVLGGAVLYVLGLFTMAHASTPVMLVLTAGVLIGTGLSGLTFSHRRRACWGDASRRRSAAWRSASRLPPARSDSSRCCRRRIIC